MIDVRNVIIVKSEVVVLKWYTADTRQSLSMGALNIIFEKEQNTLLPIYQTTAREHKL